MFFIAADVPGVPDVADSSGSTSDIQRDSAAANAEVNQALAKLRAAAADTDTQLALNLARQAFLALGLNPNDTNELSQSKTEQLRILYYNIPEVKNYIDAYDAANGKGNLVRILNADETFAAEERDKAKARIETAWMRLLGDNEMAAARHTGDVGRARFESAQQRQFWTNVVFLFASAPQPVGRRLPRQSAFAAVLSGNANKFSNRSRSKTLENQGFFFLYRSALTKIRRQ